MLQTGVWRYRGKDPELDDLRARSWLAAKMPVFGELRPGIGRHLTPVAHSFGKMKLTTPHPCRQPPMWLNPHVGSYSPQMSNPSPPTHPSSSSWELPSFQQDRVWPPPPCFRAKSYRRRRAGRVWERKDMSNQSYLNKSLSRPRALLKAAYLIKSPIFHIYGPYSVKY